MTFKARWIALVLFLSLIAGTFLMAQGSATAQTHHSAAWYRTHHHHSAAWYRSHHHHSAAWYRSHHHHSAAWYRRHHRGVRGRA